MFANAKHRRGFQHKTASNTSPMLEFQDALIHHCHSEPSFIGCGICFFLAR
jgi:hypothetical protein